MPRKEFAPDRDAAARDASEVTGGQAVEVREESGESSANGSFSIANATVNVKYRLMALTPIIPEGSMDIDVTGVMRCGL